MQTAPATQTGTTLLNAAIKKLLAEGKGWAEISQMAVDSALEQSKAPHTPQKPRSKNY